MHRLNLKYSKYYNGKNGRTGHVFQGRYKAVPVRDEKYLLSLIRYVHQNPVRAGICQKAEEYRWSSDSFYRDNINEIVDISPIMNMLSAERQMAVKKYKGFLAQKETTDYENVRSIGTGIISQLADQNPIKTIYRKSLDEILKDTGVDEESFKLIKEGSRKRILTEYKLLYVKEALKLNYTLKAIGDNIKISNVAVLDMINRRNLIT